MKEKRLLSLLLTVMLAIAAFAQGQTFTGTVVDPNGEPVIGATIVQKGTSNTTVTDVDGNFSINAPAGAELEITYVGYGKQTVLAGQNMHIVITEDAELLNEVVVVGYGTQKKSVVTASIAKVGAEDLSIAAPLRVDNALKGLASGVTVTSASGQPGASSRVRVRGIGTINNSDPLYIVDGMPIEGNIDYLNPSDIESIEVLKDAASGAVYGARAANGVILVTTKGGKQGRTSVNYNFSYGWQSPWRHRDVLNATEYAILMNEGRVNSGMAPLYDDPYSFGKGTDWQSLVFNDNAPVQTHEVNVSGANDKYNYYLSMGYYTQEGIVGGNFDRSNYNRLTLRSNNKYTLFDDTRDRSFLNKLTITANVSYARMKSRGIEVNSQWGSVLGSALTLAPTLTPTLTGDAAQAQIDYYTSLLTDAETGKSTYNPQYDKNGNLYTIPGSDYHEMNNPLALMSLPGNEAWTHMLVGQFAADLSIGWGFNYRISYGADLIFNGIDDSWTPIYYLSGNNNSIRTSAYAESNRASVWQLENVLTWDREFGLHNINVVLGQSAKKTNGWYLGGTRNNLVDPSGSKPYIDYATGLAVDGDMSVWGGPNDIATLASLFGRVSYNYDERYMLQATVRRDGSSRFGSNNHYAVFPSFSLGWNVTNEHFMADRPWWLNLMKVRFSWGKNGNENIGNYRYAVYTDANHNILLGRNEQEVRGVKAGGLANPDLKWEESTQTDVGLDFAFLNNALTFTVDWYKKRTTGMLMEMPIPNYVGEGKPIGNVGKMDNSGVEFDLGYRGHAGDFNYFVKGNATYLKNKLVNLGNETGYMNYDSFQGTGTITRAENGEPFPFFYGYKTAGIFQNMDEVRAYTSAAGSMIQPAAVPGDVRFVDVNGDGVITDADMTKLGKGMPDWTFGLSLGADWKNFDLSMMWQGTCGNKVFDATRRNDISVTNLPSWMLGRWTGEGTSDKYPRFMPGDNVNWKSSDLFVHDGSYWRLKNIMLGYTLPHQLTRKILVNSLRVYVAGENLLTFTKYHGFDPEISSGGTSLGVDYGVYPQARVWTIGFNLGF